jgi:5-methylcytosine-specific restriction protein B
MARYPDKYYIYKFGEIKTVAEVPLSDYQFRRGEYADNLRNFYIFYDELCAEIKKDEEVVRLLKSQLTEECYPDPEYRTLTIDVGFTSAATFRRKNLTY